MKIEIHIQNESVYRSHWHPYEMNFTELRRDIDRALDKVERALSNEGVSAVTINVEHYSEEVGTIKVSQDE